ncbi:MAG TPA: glycoside hydrolase family 88 protein [Ohtaekwangia sp.]|nr:glycoside hydrolase family 88 protein [Ohtaekwangia sp.]
MTKSIPAIGFSVVLLMHFYSASAQSKNDLFSKDQVVADMQKVYRWQMDNPVSFNAKNENDWARAAFYTGVMALYQTTQDQQYLDAAIRWSESFDWKLAQRFRHADDHAKGQTYLEIYEIRKDPRMIADTKNTFDSLIMDPQPGREDWWWCDALFMAPPVLARLYKATGDEKYLSFLSTMFWDTHAFLYDKDEHLFFRDKSYFDKKTPGGKKTFWARGNGWVLAGTARVLQYLPKDHPDYNKYASLFREMSAALAKIQNKKDGLWRPSLLDEKEVPHPETSGSAFFCYAMAWGVNNCILDEDKYLPVIKKSWKGLNRYLTPAGKLQWVQPIGAAPDKVTIENYQEYGSGAFLLAASEIYKLSDN